MKRTELCKYHTFGVVSQELVDVFNDILLDWYFAYTRNHFHVKLYNLTWYFSRELFVWSLIEWDLVAEWELASNKGLDGQRLFLVCLLAGDPLLSPLLPLGWRPVIFAVASCLALKLSSASPNRNRESKFGVSSILTDVTGAQAYWNWTELPCATYNLKLRREISPNRKLWDTWQVFVGCPEIRGIVSLQQYRSTLGI